MKTAVEQLKQEFFSYADPYPYFSEEDKWVITERELLELIEKAKAMEKQQIMKSAQDNFYAGQDLANGCKVDWNSSEQYYNQTYKRSDDLS